MSKPTKIEHVETILWNRWLLLRIHCEDGTVGIGEGGVHGWQRPTKTMVEVMAPYLLGKDPHRIEHHSLPKPPLPRPSPRTPLEASPSPILRGIPMPRWAALRLAESCCDGLSQRAGDAAIAARKGWPPAEACGRGDGAKKAFILPIRRASLRSLTHLRNAVRADSHRQF
jgi:hypothetical protein